MKTQDSDTIWGEYRFLISIGFCLCYCTSYMLDIKACLANKCYYFNLASMKVWLCSEFIVNLQ